MFEKAIKWKHYIIEGHVSTFIVRTMLLHAVYAVLPKQHQLAVLLLTMALIFCNVNGFAQLSRTSQEVWPLVDAYYRLNQKFRMYATVAATKLEESTYSDGAVGLFVDYFAYPPKIANKLRHNHSDSLPGKFLWLHGGYQYSATPPSSKDPFKENMFVTEANTRFYLPFDMLLTWKNRFDWRINNSKFKSRYRPRLMLERDFKTEYLFFTAYGYGEYYANFGNGSVNRFKTQLGVEIRG